jgi:glycosyltransferase involved in cell wall biosynthesis
MAYFIRMEIKTMNKIKILYIVSNLKKCGPINILYNLIKYIDKEKYKIYIVSLSPEVENTRIKEFEALNCKIYNLQLNRVKTILSKKYILKIIKENNIDIIHSHGFRADIINSKFKQYKTISTLHNYPYYDYTMAYGNKIGLVITKIHLNVLKKIDIVCGCSKFIKDMLYQYKRIDIDYIQNGVDDEIFKPTNENEKNKIREKLNLPKDKIIFIVTGEFNFRKNTSIIIESFNLRKNNNEILLFLGDGKLLETSKSVAKENLNIIFKGRVKNVEDYLKCSDYYISASLAEGLPNSVLEALATGIPCILSKIPPHEEILNNTNQIFNPNDKQDLLNIIEYITKQDYKELGKKSILTIDKSLDAKTMAKNYSSKYQRLKEGCES